MTPTQSPTQRGRIRKVNTKDNEVAQYAARLGMNDEMLKAERERSGGSDRVLLHRLRVRWSSYCRTAERRDEREFLKDEADRKRMMHEQERALMLAARVAKREESTLVERLADLLLQGTLERSEVRAVNFEARQTDDADHPSKLLALTDTPFLDEWLPRIRDVIRAAEVDMDRRLGLIRRPKDSGDERDQRILREYEGERSEAAALMEGCSSRHIEAVRTRYGRRGKDGRLRG